MTANLLETDDKQVRGEPSPEYTVWHQEVIRLRDERTRLAVEVENYVIDCLLVTSPEQRAGALKVVNQRLKEALPVTHELTQYATDPEIDSGARLRYDVFKNRDEFNSSVIRNIVGRVNLHNPIEQTSLRQELVACAGKFYDEGGIINSKNFRSIRRTKSGGITEESLQEYNIAIGELADYFFRVDIHTDEGKRNLELLFSIIHQESSQRISMDSIDSADIEARTILTQDIFLALLNKYEQAETAEATQVEGAETMPNLSEKLTDYYRSAAELKGHINKEPININN